MTFIARLGLVFSMVAVLVGAQLLEREKARARLAHNTDPVSSEAALSPLVPASLPNMSPAAAAKAFTYYTVRRGDTLGVIAQRTAGTSQRWKLLLDLNKEVLDDPRKLRPGMRLKVPDALWLKNLKKDR